MTIAEVFQAWATDHAFLDFWIAACSAIAYQAYCWEMPPLTASSLSEPFECVFFDDTSLASARPDPAPFAAQFATTTCAAVAFKNLRGDAWLVAPCPTGDSAPYAHLAAFLRGAPLSQSHEFWTLLAATVLQTARATPQWLSTAGHGVHWLHARIDTRPKYFQSRAYANPRYWAAQNSPRGE